MSIKRRDFLKQTTHLGAAATLGTLDGSVLHSQASMAGQSASPGVMAKDLVDGQVQAYNSRDLEGFLELYVEKAEFYNFPGQLLFSGKNAMRARYGRLFASAPDLHCEVLNRIVLDNTVILLEHITGKPDGVSELAVVYTVTSGLIARVDFIRSKATS